MESLVPDLSKITKAERIEEMVFKYVWLSGIKALLALKPFQTQTHIFRQGIPLK
jgi:hypothetical protein